MNESSKEVLSFGGLTIQPLISDEHVYCPSPVVFDPLLLRFEGAPNLRGASVGTVLSPLGECWEVASLFIGADYRMYVMWSSFFDRLGDSFEEGLSILVLANKKWERLAP
jgi:hypothetical protein